MLLTVLLLLTSGSMGMATPRVSFTAQLQHIMTVKNAKTLGYKSPNGAPLPPVPPSDIIAKIRAAAAAEEVLASEAPSREYETTTNMLESVQPRALARLPAGAQAWCPLLQQEEAERPGEPSPRQLAEAINSATAPKAMDWQAAMSDELAALPVAGAWWSGKRRPVS